MSSSYKTNPLYYSISTFFRASRLCYLFSFVALFISMAAILWQKTITLMNWEKSMIPLSSYFILSPPSGCPVSGEVVDSKAGLAC